MAFAPQGLFAQSLPEFDESDFEIVALHANDSAIVRSDGRDFLCSIATSYAGGYLRISFCLPFVGRTEANEQDSYIARIELERAKAEAEKAKQAALLVEQQAADDVEKLKIENATAEIAAELAFVEQAKLNAKKLDAEKALVDVTDAELRVLVKRVLKSEPECTLHIGDRTIKDRSTTDLFWRTLGFTIDLNEPQVKKFARRLVTTLRGLYRTREIKYLESAAKIQLRVCQ